jgi:hypothetical protein
MNRIFLASAIAICATGGVHALEAVRALEGYACMSLNLTEEEMWQESAFPPVLQQPSASSQQIGLTGASVAVASPMVIVNGYARMLFKLGQEGWIAANMLRPYKVPGKPKAICIPSLMSNGRLGFDYRG